MKTDKTRIERALLVFDTAGAVSALIVQECRVDAAGKDVETLSWREATADDEKALEKLGVKAAGVEKKRADELQARFDKAEADRKLLLEIVEDNGLTWDAARRRWQYETAKLNDYGTDQDDVVDPTRRWEEVREYGRNPDGRYHEEAQAILAHYTGPIEESILQAQADGIWPARWKRETPPFKYEPAPAPAGEPEPAADKVDA